MESNDLLRTENDENQDLNATPGASEEAQKNVAAPAVESAETQPELQSENTHPVQPETPAVVEEPAPAEDPTPAEEPALAEEPVATEPAPEQPATVSEMMSDIENADAQTSETEENETAAEESPDQIEAEYKDLPLEQSVEEFHRIVADPDINKIKQRVGILRVKIIAQLKEERKEQREKFIAEGGNEADFTPEVSETEKKFNESLQVFKSNKAKYLENLEIEKQNNLKAKNDVLEELRVLVESESNLKELNDKFKVLQEKWKNIGPVPQGESNNLWENYHFYVEKFYDILRINKELRSLDLKKNMEQKIKLCEAAESLILQESINKSFNELQELHNQWREIGPVPEEKKEELWERFKAASDQVNQRRREHYEQIFAEQQNNYNAKVVLCEKAEEVAAQPTESIKEYNAVGDQLSELLKVWKTLGAAPPKVNEEIWTRFKGTLDRFFEKKKEFFGKVKEEQQNNYNKKVDLAIRAEAIAKRTDWRAATDEILQLQKEWKEVGATAQRHSEAIWKRFRAACDEFFEAKSNYFKNIDSIEAENLHKKEELIQRIENHEFGPDKNENLEAIKAYQREWTEIGFVPIKEKDRLYTAYREAVNKRFAELKVSMEDVRHSHFRNRVENILNSPNADKVLDKEKRFLTNKLTQLKSDISLWENNLGFFANSKNADLLKAEFSKKIEAAKQEVKDLEYKIKMMDKPKEE